MLECLHDQALYKSTLPYLTFIYVTFQISVFLSFMPLFGHIHRHRHRFLLDHHLTCATTASAVTTYRRIEICILLSASHYVSKRGAY